MFIYVTEEIMTSTQILLLCLCGAAFLVIGLITAIGSTYSLKGIPSKPVARHGAVCYSERNIPNLQADTLHARFVAAR